MSPARCTVKATKIDSSGLLTIPIELRRNYRLQAGDEIEIFADEDGLIMVRPAVQGGTLRQTP